MSLSTFQRSRLRVLAEEYAQALGNLRVAEREMQQKRQAYVDLVLELGGDGVNSPPPETKPEER